VLDLVLLEELVVQEEHGPSGIAEDVLDPLLLHAANEDLGTGDLHDEAKDALKMRKRGTLPSAALGVK
jgi:hypothetical protein